MTSGVAVTSDKKKYATQHKQSNACVLAVEVSEWKISEKKNYQRKV